MIVYFLGPLASRLTIATTPFLVVKSAPANWTACQQYYAQMSNPPGSAVAWCEQGKYVRWKSSLPENDTFGELRVFTTCLGDKTNPAIVLIHGYPTSSYDFYKLANLLSKDAYVCALDAPGHGFSDKPRNGYRYSIFDDARLVDHFIQEVVGLEELTLLTHDKGDSVGLALLQIYHAYGVRPYRIKQHIITNGNIYLPLARLSGGQKLLLNPLSGPLFARMLSGRRMARSMGGTVYSPQLTRDEEMAVASILDYQEGCRVQHSLIQYLNERRKSEVAWLEELARSDVPATLIWGELDPIAPTAVADYVWANYLKNRRASASYWRVPCANHYLQVDHPGIIADLIRSAIGVELKTNSSVSPSCRPYQIK